jgi:hypothetical protein
VFNLECAITAIFVFLARLKWSTGPNQEHCFFTFVASFWFSSVAVGFALFSPARAKYEDLRFMTLPVTHHA